MEKVMKYVETKIVFQEIPNEITLAINISNCPCKCRECHSKYLWEDIGEPLILPTIDTLIENNQGISCICFMGGDSDPAYINILAQYVRTKYPQLKIAWYSGRTRISSKINLNYLDFIKVGRYNPDRGPINNPNTNQIFYEIINNNLINKTYLFWKQLAH